MSELLSEAPGGGGGAFPKKGGVLAQKLIFDGSLEGFDKGGGDEYNGGV